MKAMIEVISDDRVQVEIQHSTGAYGFRCPEKYKGHWTGLSWLPVEKLMEDINTMWTKEEIDKAFAPRRHYLTGLANSIDFATFFPCSRRFTWIVVRGKSQIVNMNDIERCPFPNVTVRPPSFEFMPGDTLLLNKEWTDKVLELVRKGYCKFSYANGQYVGHTFNGVEIPIPARTIELLAPLPCSRN
jgi:hypothetical protein